MSTSMNIHHLIMDYMSLGAIEQIHQALHGIFITRNNGGREDDRIIRLGTNIFMFTARNAHQSSAFFSLSASADNRELMIGIFFHLLRFNDGAWLVFEITQLMSNINVADNTTASKDNFTAIFFREPNDLLDATQERSKGASKNTSGSITENSIQFLANIGFRKLIAGAISVGTIRENC